MRYIAKILLLMAFTMQIVLAVPSIRINNIKALPSPMKSVEENGEGNITFNIYEANGEVVPATVSGDVNTEITVDLKKLRLKNNDVVNSIFGEIHTYFDIQTINDGTTIVFRQKADIPGDSFELVRIEVEVTENAIEPTNQKVGALVNIAATTGAQGDGSAYVFTTTPPTIDAVDDTMAADPGAITTTVFVNDDADGTSPATNILIERPTIENNGGLAGLSIDDNGLLYIPADATPGTYTISYEICLTAATSICDIANVALTVNANLPDYTPKIKLYGASTSGASTVVPAVLTVTELLMGANTDDVIIRIPKHDYISFTYDNSMTQLGFSTVNNSDWELIDHPAEYRFKYIGNGTAFPTGSFARIGLNLIVEPDVGTSGQIDFTVDIRPGNGDTNAQNDSDSSKIDYAY